MVDIAPELLEQLQRRFSEKVSVNPKIRALYKRIQSGNATYADAEDYAYLVGEALSQTFGEILSSSVLPDGRMYYNIADRVVRPLLLEDHSLISDAAAQVQKALNEKAKIGIKPQTVAVNEDRISGIVDKISNAEQFDDVAWVLDEPVKNFSMNVVDETLKANINFQGKAGRHPRIIRKSEWKCCDWCRHLAGEYEYPDVPDDVYRRHENCRCTVEYDPGDGTRRNVHTKKQLTTQDDVDTIEERRKIGLGNLGTFRPNDHHGTIQKHVGINRADVAAAAKAGMRHSGVYTDAVGKTKKQLQRSIINRTAQVERHADKIKNPKAYVPNWESLNPNQQSGLIRKWEKDMRRNAEQAEIELSVFEERF